MALNTQEIDKVNDLYNQLDAAHAENTTLKEQIADRFDNIEKLLAELAKKLDSHEKHHTK